MLSRRTVNSMVASAERIECRLVTGVERHAAEDFLRQQGYSNPIQEADQMFAAFQGSIIVATVRLATEDGVTVLRGMRVTGEFQRRGIGRRLLQYAARFIPPGPCYCIAWEWLVGFYGEVGFRPIGAATAPAFLASRFEAYRTRGGAVVLLARSPRAN